MIAIDWGTSSLRGARLARDGTVLEERAYPRGILTVPPGGYTALFEAHFGDGMQPPGALCLIAGMAGSQQGWLEAPYCPCPAGFDELRACEQLLHTRSCTPNGAARRCKCSP